MQANILHPLAELDCQYLGVAEDMKERSIYSVLLGDTIYMLCESYSQDGTCLCKYNLSEKAECFHTIYSKLPAIECGLTTYQSKLVLVSGRGSKALWTSDIDANFCWDDKEFSFDAPFHLQCQELLPPLSTARSWPSVINTKDPEYIVVAGGTGESDELSTVEVLIEDQWWCIGALPNPVRNFAIHGEKLYLSGKRIVHHCNLKISNLKSFFSHSNHDDEPSWTSFPVPEYDTFESPCHLTSIGQHLMALDSSILSVYSPVHHSMVPAARFEPYLDDSEPVDLRDSVVLPNGNLILIINATSLYHGGIMLYEVSVTGKKNFAFLFSISYMSLYTFFRASI